MQEPNKKVFPSIEALVAKCAELRAAGQRIVLTTAVCDVMHSGHFEYFYDAKSQGDFLVIGVDSDVYVRSVKGPDRPIRDQAERARALSYLASVDALVIYDVEADLVRAIHPDVLVVSTTSHVQLEDDPPRLAVVQEIGCQVVRYGKTVPYSTTNMLAKIRTPEPSGS